MILDTEALNIRELSEVVGGVVAGGCVVDTQPKLVIELPQQPTPPADTELF
ncbi:hypothetical protein ISG33_16735 [Glaciecola sp. MH2013]|uniref:hypothetical protein n=1 Tax=Glaciecola sp. MH2013 TaxID=2785524 RepID=UPI00189CE21E|nr:hypothetical protein [Glaciecola sp. MH2013]MBF7075050.1 hypothetical protein [Glaciecola sp. MH2013]